MNIDRSLRRPEMEGRLMRDGVALARRTWDKEDMVTPLSLLTTSLAQIDPRITVYSPNGAGRRPGLYVLTTDESKQSRLADIPVRGALTHIQQQVPSVSQSRLLVFDRLGIEEERYVNLIPTADTARFIMDEKELMLRALEQLIAPDSLLQEAPDQKLNIAEIPPLPLDQYEEVVDQIYQRVELPLQMITTVHCMLPRLNRQ